MHTNWSGRNKGDSGKLAVFQGTGSILIRLKHKEMSLTGKHNQVIIKFISHIGCLDLILRTTETVDKW